MSERIVALVAEARERVPELGEPTLERGEVSVEVPRARLVEVAMWLRDEGPFELLADWSAVDFLGVAERTDRFELAAHLASVSHPDRLRLRVGVPEGDERCPSLAAVWPGANVQEREIYDFFGISFDGHPDMRRIFMPDEWEGHPQRKDYPLGGVNVAYHGAFIPPPDVRGRPATTTGYPGRHA